jgi:hypothetical protein
MITILGFGSLLSERSSRTTFPELQNFRLARVPNNYRRVFAHATAPFFHHGIALPGSNEIASLSAELVEGEGRGFICTAFEVDSTDMMENGVPSQAFLEREKEFEIMMVPFYDLQTGKKCNGILCTQSTDEAYFKRWGKEYFEKEYGPYGIQTIWNWDKDSDLKPCAVYLRHCTLAAQSMGEICYTSFLDDTYLVDRKTTIRSYLEQNPHVMEAKPPPALEGRWGG